MCHTGVKHPTHTNTHTYMQVVAENAVKLEENDFVFFRDLARLAPAGSLFVLTESSHHM